MERILSHVTRISIFLLPAFSTSQIQRVLSPWFLKWLINSLYMRVDMKLCVKVRAAIWNGNTKFKWLLVLRSVNVNYVTNIFRRLLHGQTHFRTKRTNQPTDQPTNRPTDQRSTWQTERERERERERVPYWEIVSVGRSKNMISKLLQLLWSVHFGCASHCRALHAILRPLLRSHSPCPIFKEASRYPDLFCLEPLRIKWIYHREIIILTLKEKTIKT